MPLHRTAHAIATKVRNLAPTDWAVRALPNALTIRATRIRNRCEENCDFTISAIRMQDGSSLDQIANRLLSVFLAEFAKFDD
jgi:hypothetical protein